jgi:hypothetical protein
MIPKQRRSAIFGAAKLSFIRKKISLIIVFNHSKPILAERKKIHILSDITYLQQNENFLISK